MTTKHISMFLAAASLGCGLFAQTPKAQALLMALSANGKQMTTYQWKQRATILRKGQQAGFRTEEVRFDQTGQPHHVTIAQSEQKKMGPLRAHKAAEVRDDIQEVMHLAARYANPQQLAQVIQRGEIWEGRGTLRVHSQSVILPGDDLTMSVNGATYLATRVDVKSHHDGRPVTIAIDYQQLPNGPNMPARMTVQIPEDNVVVNVETFDFIRLAGSNLP